MKGGRLHRPEPPGPPHASAAPPPAAPAPTPADDWVDGSWTVDCSCGVTFDDGEEMVSCDDCSVWVHTRCARYLRGVHASFSCHNCRRRRSSAAADETEVAELLAELPTHRPPLYRRWAEVPLPARVHVHGGADAALFRGSPSTPAFSAALWRCAGYVPKKFGFRYCEFPSWADDKDGADALFALARENRKDTAPPPAPRFNLSLGNNNAQTLTKKTEGSSQHAAAHGAKGGVPPLTYSSKTKGAPKVAAKADARDQPKGDLNTPDAMRKDQPADTSVANSDVHVVVEASKKVNESLESSGDKKSSEGNLMMPKTEEPMEPMRPEVPSGGGTTSAVAEQEAHSQFIKTEVNTCGKQIEGSQNAGLRSGIIDAVAGTDGDTRVHAGSVKAHGGLGLQKQSNQASSDLQDHERTKSAQFINDEHRSDTQGPGVSAGFLTAQRNSTRSQSDSGSDPPNSETKNQMNTVPEQNSVSGAQKISTASSGPIEISHSSVSAEPSSVGKTGRLMKKEETRLVAPADIKHESIKHSAESSKVFSRSSEKVQSKGSLSSAPKSSQISKSYVPSAKQRVPLPKDQTHKAPTPGGTPARSFHGEVTPSHSRNKAIPSNLPQKKEKIHHRFVHVPQEGSTNTTSTELRASDVTASLSDEQLALLLHQQLNSSPRVPRVPRGNQTGSMQMLHQTGATVFSKRPAHGGKDQTPVLKKRHKDDVPLRDNDDSKRPGKVPLVERRNRDYSTERTPSVKDRDSCRNSDNVALEEQNHGMCSDEATTGLTKADLVDSGLPRSLPGFIDEIISRNRNITYEELCDDIGEHWRDFVKPKGDDYAYSSFLHAVDECLRTNSEWAHLVSQAPKTNPNKRRKVESNSSSGDVMETEKTRNQAGRDPGEEGSSESQQGPTRGRRKGWKRSHHEMKAYTRKRSTINSSSEDAAASLSASSSNPIDDESQEDNSSGGDRQRNSTDSGS